MRSKIFIVLILVIFLGLAVTIKPKQIGGGFVYSKELGIKDSKIFNLSASMLGEGIDSYDGDFSLSPDGDKIAFTGLKQEPGFDTGSSPYLFILNLKTGTLKKFEKGTTLFDWESSDILSYASQSSTHLYDTANDVDIASITDYSNGKLSPNKKLYAFNGLLNKQGLFILSLDTKDITQISEDSRDTFGPWFSDSNKILIGKNLKDGNSPISVFNVKNKKLDNLEINGLFTDNVFRTELFWIEPDNIILLYPSTIIDLKSDKVLKKIEFTGDEIQSADAPNTKIGYFGISPFNANTLQIYNKYGSLVAERKNSHWMESVREFIDKDKVLLSSEDAGVGATHEYILWNMNDNTQKILNSNSKNYNLQLFPDHIHWIAQDTKRFYLGKIK
ncbi:MAG: hypothetical protein UV08_C0038G0003 [Parcubacteria group bacterium GW2011_GWA2_42_18]|nr:MAG: hypothetical protein UV08_C0038G0003 [Parcubacteria group bacterium GW2011_GWA2_42_18]